MDGVEYDGTGPLDRSPELTSGIVAAVVPGCDDDGGDGTDDEPDRTIEVSEIRGVSPQVAVWSGTGLYVRRDAELPRSTRSWFRPLDCSADGPATLVVEWRGVTSKAETGTLRTPLSIEAAIVSTTPPSDAYARYTIEIADDGPADPALDEHAADEALTSTRAYLRVQVHCDGRRFVADSFELVPR